MEDVIFQGAATRRPINVTEVSLYLDNSDGDLPIAYREVQITRRLSRSGQSDYRDIHDLLRGTGLGSDAGVVIEAKMIDLLLSDRAEERRSLFEEAAGIGLYRDRKHSTERRLGGRPDCRSPIPDPELGASAGQGPTPRQVDGRQARGRRHAGTRAFGPD
jgi:chromosome segregation protein